MALHHSNYAYTVSSLLWIHRDSSVFWAKLITMQLTYFVVHNVVQGYNCGKTVPIFHKQTEAPAADSCCKILLSRTTENQKFLFTYVNAVVKASWL